MEIWLDTLDVTLIEAALARMPVTGITTNPKLLRNLTEPLAVLLDKILPLGIKHIAVQIDHGSVNDMIKSVERLRFLSDVFLPKIPATYEGFAAMYELKQRGWACLATTIIEPSQVLQATWARADYAAVYVSQLRMPGEELKLMQDICRQSQTKLMLASLRSLQQLIEGTILSVAAATLNDTMLQMLFKTPAEVVSKLAEL